MRDERKSLRTDDLGAQDEVDARKKLDAIIVGAGVAGLSIARELAIRGMSVAIVERSASGAESSHAAAGLLAPQAEADRDDDLFRLLCASRDFYADFAVTLRRETGVDIELDATGTLYVAVSERDEREIEKRFAWQRAAGFRVERLSTAAVRRTEPNISDGVRLALRFPHDTQVENRRLVRALLHALENLSVPIYENVSVERLRLAKDGEWSVETSAGSFRGQRVIVAAGAWASRLPIEFAESDRAARDIFRPDSFNRANGIEPVRGQMLCFRTDGKFLRHVVYSPRVYFVPRRDGRLLVGATVERAGFDKSVTAGGIHQLMSDALEVSDALRELRFSEAWAGLRPFAAHGQPVIGEAGRGLFYAAGYYRNGILIAPFVARLLAAQICGDADEANHLLQPFTPDAHSQNNIAVTDNITEPDEIAELAHAS